MFKIKDSKVGGATSPKIPEGKFRLAIEKNAAKVSENKALPSMFGHPLAIVEFTVKEIFHQAGIDVAKREKDGEAIGKERFTVKPVAVGQRVGWMLDMTKDTSGGNLISYCAATLGVANPQDAGQVAEAEAVALEMASDIAKGLPYEKDFDKLLADYGPWGMLYQGYASEKQPMLGEEIICECQQKRTKEGYAFTVLNWYPVDSDAAEQPAA